MATQPAVGQVWRDNDPRAHAPEFTIEAIGFSTVRVVRTLRSGKTQHGRISIDRLLRGGSRGYSLVREAL